MGSNNYPLRIMVPLLVVLALLSATIGGCASPNEPARPEALPSRKPVEDAALDYVKALISEDATAAADAQGEAVDMAGARSKALGRFDAEGVESLGTGEVLFLGKGGEWPRRWRAVVAAVAYDDDPVRGFSIIVEGLVDEGGAVSITSAAVDPESE